MKTIIKKWYYKKLQQKGQKFLTQGKIEKANAIFNKVLLVDSSTENLYNLGLSYLGLNQFEEAERIFEKIYKHYPENSINKLSLAEAKLMLKKWDEAAALFSSMIEKNPNQTSLKNYLEISQDVVLREKFRKTKKLINRARNALTKKQDEQALTYLKEALDYNPENSHILNNIGSIYSMQKKYEKALEYYEKAIKFDSNNLKIKRNIALAKRKMK